MRPFAPFNARPMKQIARPKPGPASREDETEDAPMATRAARRPMRFSTRPLGPALRVLKVSKKSA